MNIAELYCDMVKNEEYKKRGNYVIIFFHGHCCPEM